MVTKTPEELEMLSPEALKAYLADEEKIVFGQDVERKGGAPVEKGIGSPGRETVNHFTALRKYEGEEAYREAYNELAKRNPDHLKKLNLPKPKPSSEKAA